LTLDWKEISQSEGYRSLKAAYTREAQKNKAAISDLVETSERMKAKSAQYDADIQVYVTALDSLN